MVIYYSFEGNYFFSYISLFYSQWRLQEFFPGCFLRISKLKSTRIYLEDKNKFCTGDES